MLDGSSLRSQEVRELIKGDQFDEALGDLLAEAATDPLAQELTDVIRGVMDERFAESGIEGQVTQLACGMRVCVAAVEPYSSDASLEQWLDAWSAGPARVHYAMAVSRYVRPDRSAEFRMVFSTDPESNSFIGRPAPFGG
jgi:hypothetical protein